LKINKNTRVIALQCVVRSKVASERARESQLFSLPCVPVPAHFRAIIIIIITIGGLDGCPATPFLASCASPLGLVWNLAKGLFQLMEGEGTTE